MSPPPAPVLDAILALFDERGTAFRRVDHAPTRTSEESAAARGEELRIGGKALLLRVDEEFRLFVLSAAAQLDSGKLRRHFGARKTRFATPEELLELSGLVPGSVPPFGAPILPFPLFADEGLLENERIAFNAGSLTTSLVLALADWRELARPEFLRFTK